MEVTVDEQQFGYPHSNNIYVQMKKETHSGLKLI